MIVYSQQLIPLLNAYEVGGVAYVIERVILRHRRNYVKSLVAKGANTQLDPSCVSAPLATNVDLFVYFAKRLFKSSSISH